MEDVAFRVISGNRQPDHATIARFLVAPSEAVSGLFDEVLGLCRAGGDGVGGGGPIDGTKIEANASTDQNRSLGLRAEAKRILREGEETDRREDELYGDERGDELPEELADPRTREAQIRELLEQAAGRA